MSYVLGRGEVYTEFWRGKPEGKRPLGRSRRRYDERAWTGSMWLRIETGGGHL